MSLPQWWFLCLVVAADGGRGLFSHATNYGRGMSACDLPAREVLPAGGVAGTTDCAPGRCTDCGGAMSLPRWWLLCLVVAEDSG